MEVLIRSISGLSFFVILVISVLHLLLFFKFVVGVTDQEFEILTEALRSSGSNLFGNAIATSDLRYQILAGDSFTFFWPNDSALFSLDMAFDASNYVQTLRYHVVPRRLLISDLRNLFLGSYLDTLLPNHSVRIGRSQINATENFSRVVTVDGVRISAPDLYLGQRVAVHGLDGILSAQFPSEMNFPSDTKVISPVISPGKHISPLSSPMVSDLNTPRSSPQSVNVSAETYAHSRSKKHGKDKKHQSNRKRSEQKVHGHHRHENNDDSEGIGNKKVFKSKSSFFM